ncbi:MAG: uroporphyrinogen-III synthase, partial [Bacteroidota bacterium]
MANKLFISRQLNPNGPLRKSLKPLDLTIIDIPLVQFSFLPFELIPASDWLFFYSRNGVKFFFEGLKRLDISFNHFKDKKWAAMGEGTANTLKKYINKVDFVGDGQPSTTAKLLLKMAQKEKVLFVRAKQSKMSVQRLLTDQLEMDDLIVYDNTIKKDFLIPTCDLLLFTSPLNARAYFQKYFLQPEQKVLAIGNTTGSALHKIGINRVYIAENPSEAAMANLVLQLINTKKVIPNMSNKYAVIDLGTNTFHLLVAKKLANGGFQEI